MEPTLGVGLLWVVFGGTHIGLATGPIRGRLVARLGELGFTAFFYLVASTSFGVLVAYYAAHRFEGTAGLALASIPVMRSILMIVAVAGLALTAPALAVYPRLPTAVFGQPIRTPRGIERITRHPFFAGFALFAVAHALLATRLVGTVFFAGFALLSALGAWHQDLKQLARRGTAYADYLAATSAVPFAAVVSGRQRLVWRELPVAALAVGIGVALALRARHDAIFAHGGAWVIGVVVGGGFIAGLNAWRRSHRVAAPTVDIAPAPGTGEVGG
jgi:uncharacterized membrane protein